MTEVFSSTLEEEERNWQILDSSIPFLEIGQNFVNFVFLNMLYRKN